MTRARAGLVAAIVLALLLVLGAWMLGMGDRSDTAGEDGSPSPREDTSTTGGEASVDPELAGLALDAVRGPT